MTDFTKKIEEVAKIRVADYDRDNEFLDLEGFVLEIMKIFYIEGAQEALEILASGEGYDRKWIDTLAENHDMIEDGDIAVYTATDEKPQQGPLNFLARTKEYISIQALASIAAKLELANNKITELLHTNEDLCGQLELANAEIEEQKSMRSKDQNAIEAKDHEIVMLKSENQKLTEQLSDFKKCVEFYCDKAKMNHGITFAEDGGGFIGYINEDDFELITSNDHKLDYFVSGKLARATLNKYKSSTEQGRG